MLFRSKANILQYLLNMKRREGKTRVTPSTYIDRKFKKKQKKIVKTQKHKNNSRIAIRLLSHFFSNEQNCLLHSLKFLFCQYLFHILTMMYNIFDINATEVKTNIQCK